MEPRPPAGALPAQPFFSTPQQRLALARQRFFEDGVRPSGLINDLVIQSWSRCVQAHRDPTENIAFNPVTTSRIHSALARSRQLLEAAATDLSQLETTLAGTACTAILTDPYGVVVHATRSPPNPHEVLMPLARRVGANLAEAHVGTAAPSVTTHSGQACLVLGAEHFFGSLQQMYCAAAPIHDVHGRLAAVLDVTSEGQPFGFDAAAVVSMYATTIENQLLRAQSLDHIVVRLQTTASMLGTPMEGLAGLAADGSIAWTNNVGARLAGVVQAQAGLRADEVFGLDLNALLRLTRTPTPSLHRLPNGLNVWLTAHLQARDGATRLFKVPEAPEAPAAVASHTEATPAVTAAAHADAPPFAIAPDTAGTLRDNDRLLVQQTLQACEGNVSRAARKLGVSRGLVYRHLKQPDPA
ncbi:MAG: helix-turn-helix domain-containing protein [Burkholderiales bacterium]|nr:helix-turn-helix domain-containing protein [Burkholderiales bacterium]